MSGRADIVRELAADLGVESTTAGNVVETAVAHDDLPRTIAIVARNGGRLLTIYAASDDDAVTARYVFDGDAGDDAEDVLFVISVTLDRARPELISIAEHHPAASWYEREMHDLLGVTVVKNPDTRPLALHAGRSTEPPLAPDASLLAATHSGTYRWTHVEGDGLSTLAMGPVRGAIRESAILRLTLFGDKIVHAEPRLFYKHRGAEKLACSMAPDHAVLLASRLCGSCPVSNASAMAAALESLSATDIPKRAVWLRTIALELERLRSHASSIAALTFACDWHDGGNAALLSREELLAECEATIGSRLLSNFVTPGGVRRDLERPKELLAAVRSASASLRQLVHRGLEIPEVRERLETRGELPPEVIADLALSGPISRAAGERRDVRTAHPYLAYAELSPFAPTYWSGDALGRLRVWHEEIAQSGELIEELITNLPTGKIAADLGELLPQRRQLAMVESPRGANLHAVHTDRDGQISRWHLRGASTTAWIALPFAMIGQRAADVALIEASFGLCTACVDR